MQFFFSLRSTIEDMRMMCTTMGWELSTVCSLVILNTFTTFTLLCNSTLPFLLFSISFTLLTAGMIVLCLVCLWYFTFCVFIVVRWYLLPEIQCGERSSIFLLMSFPSRLIFCVPILFIHLHVIICIGILENLYGNHVPDDTVKWFLHAVI